MGLPILGGLEAFRRDAQQGDAGPVEELGVSLGLDDPREDGRGLDRLLLVGDEAQLVGRVVADDLILMVEPALDLPEGGLVPLLVQVKGQIDDRTLGFLDETGLGVIEPDVALVGAAGLPSPGRRCRSGTLLYKRGLGRRAGLEGNLSMSSSILSSAAFQLLSKRRSLASRNRDSSVAAWIPAVPAVRAEIRPGPRQSEDEDQTACQGGFSHVKPRFAVLS